MDSFSDMRQLMRLAQSPAGQRLIALLQQRGGERLSAAIALASAGDYQQAQALLSDLLAQEDARSLVKALEESQ
ncbi:MAG TPA: hypothetical protein DFH97_04350 [Clostridiales bacterium]|nr:hypothetical protein [Clostridiales bacterium]HCI64253.1 hypothetical protein [Clostridiales bacterium]